MNGNDIQRGLILAFAGALILSFDTLLIRLIGENPLTIAFWRGILMALAGASVCLFLSLVKRRELSLPLDGLGIAVSLLYGAASVGFVAGALLTSVANLLVIVATAPLWAPIGAFVFLRERTPVSTLACSFASIGGIAVVAIPNGVLGLRAGDLIALVTAWSMAAAFVLSRKSSKNIALAPAFGGLFSALALLPFIERFTFAGPWQTFLMTIEGGVVVPLALTLIASAPRYLPAPQVGLFLLLETILGPLWIWVVLSIAPSPYALIGGLIVVLCLVGNSVFLLTTQDRGK